MRIIILVLMMISFNAQADTKIGLILYAPHFDRDNITNNTPEGIYIEHDGYGIGNLTNSYSDNSSFVYKRFDLMESISVNLGVIDGYEKNVYNMDGFLPLVSINYEYKVFTASVIANAVVLGLRFDL